MGGEGEERRGTLEKERNEIQAAAFPMCVRKAVAGSDFVEKVAVFGGWLRKAQLPVAARPDHQVVGPPAISGVKRALQISGAEFFDTFER